MIKSRYISYIFIFVALLFHSLAFAQDLPKMPVDKAVVSGVLPNGISYYVVANSDTKGMADFALVQKSGSTFTDKIQTSEISERLMSCLPELDSLSPRKFFIRNGVVPKNGRFISTKNGAAIFRFRNVVVTEKSSVLDSTLLILMGMVRSAREQEDDFARSCYAPSQSAIIVSGDVKSDQIVEKIKMLSYMIPSQASVTRGEYQWEDKQPVFKVVPADKKTSEIKVSWTMPATPKAYTGTIQPAVHSMLINELGYIASVRIRQALKSKGVALAEVKYGHNPSSSTGSDEMFWMSATVSSKATMTAVSVMSEVFSSLSREGISFAEQKYAHNHFMRQMFNKARSYVRKDSEYVDVCVNAFLTGAAVIQQSQLYDFYSSKDVCDTVEVNMLDRMASAMMSVDKNLEVVCDAAGQMSVDSLKNAFVSSWANAGAVSPVDFVQVSDTLKKVVISAKKLPVNSQRKEYLSGGHLWTFGNGIRVAYKRMETGGKMYWAWGLNGGYGSIRNLNKGEGAFVGDMLKLTKVAGMPWEDYMLYLEEQEIYLDARVGLHTTIISGSSNDYELPALMRALKAIMTEREIDAASYPEYMRTEWLRQDRTAGNSRVVIDSLMCPGYKYSSIKTQGVLSEGLLSKSEELFANLFAKANDGVLVLVGDVEESLLRKQLREYLGDFSTSKYIPPRPLISYQPTSGSMTHVAEGERNAVYIALSIPMPVTLRNHAVSEIAGMLLNNYISSSLVGSGMYAKVFWDTRITPHERYSVMVVLEEVQGMNIEGAEKEALSRVYKILSPEGVEKVADSQLDACKQWLKNNHALQMKSPQYWVNAMMLRYLEGKDLTTGYDKEIDAVTTDMVKSLLVSLNDASKVEYIIRNK